MEDRIYLSYRLDENLNQYHGSRLHPFGISIIRTPVECSPALNGVVN